MAAGPSLEARLERGEVIEYPVCPFGVPAGDDHQFLLAQRLGSRAHKNISYNPRTGKSGGYAYQSAAQANRLHDLLARFSHTVTQWVSETLPLYTRAWRLDMVSYRPEEEATRVLRQKARNDLLHVDAFPSRPTNGWRILRVFVNINPAEPRVWVTSDPFAKLFERYGGAARLPTAVNSDWVRQIGHHVLRLFRPGRPARSPYDAFMLRFHDYLKADEAFQERGPKRFWKFAPGSAWMCMTDTCSHAVLRGRYALEHSYFIAPAALAVPNESPAAILERACGLPVLHRAA